MASGDKEHRMLFDIRGKRRNVVKVVYAILALLMGLSLFLLAGPVGGIFNSSDGGNSEAVSRIEDEAAKVERKLAKEPENSDLLLRLTRMHTSAANLLAEPGPSGEPLLTVESRQQFEKASATWSEYLEATDEPAAGAAQVMSQALFSLASTSRSYNEAESNVAAAAEAQQIVAAQRPSIGTLSTASFYTLYTFDYQKAEELLDEAKKFANTKFERENLDNQYEENEKSAKEFEKRSKEAKKAAEQAAKQGTASPQESLRNPFGLGGGAGTAE